jgi:PHYB activation tagged suppressor 1
MVIEHSLPHAGQTYVYWFGDTPDVFIGDVDMVRQVLSNRMGLFLKNPMNEHFARLLAKGLPLIDGDDWKRHRKVVHPAFNVDKLKVYRSQLFDQLRFVMYFSTFVGTCCMCDEVLLGRCWL